MLWQKVKQLLLGDEKEFELEHRVFNFYCVLGLVISFFVAILSFYLNFPLIVVQMLAFSAMILLCWYLSRVCLMFNLSTFIAAFGLILIFTPCFWFTNCGSNGGAQYYFIFWGVLISSVYRGWRRYIWLAVLLVVTILLMYMEFRYPHMIFTYNSRFARNLDVYISFIMAMAVTTGVFIMYADSYRREHERVKEYAERLEKIAVTDGLTGLYNHTHLYERLEEEIYKAGRYLPLLTLVMIDIDYFKDLNDRYGHPTGDGVLAQVANVLRSNIRASDIVGRYGGEEFLIICPETGLEGAVSIAEKLRTMVEASSLGETGQIKTTISCGVVRWNGEDLNEIINKVDKALYAAKRAGRNRVEVYREAPPAAETQ